MTKTTRIVLSEYLSTRKNPFLDENVGKVMREITAQTEQKTILEIMKDLLRRGRSSTRNARWHGSMAS